MFLVTTALENTWNTDKNILFLGQWCLRYSRRASWSQLSYRVSRFHWDERDRLPGDYARINEVYNKYLPLLAERLNHLHDCQYSLRYWAILLGPWLRTFIEVLFDRYQSLRQALAEHSVQDTWVLDCELEAVTANTTEQFLMNLVDDFWNYHIYSEIIKRLQLCSYTQVALQSLTSISKHPYTSLKFSFRHKIAAAIQNCLHLFQQNYVFYASGMRKQALLRLQSHLRQLPLLDLYLQPLDVEAEYSLEQRETLKLEPVGDEFEDLLVGLLCEQIPKIYVEAYAACRDQVQDKPLPKSRVIVTSSATRFDEGFKFRAAAAVEVGTKLVIAQHGGNYAAPLCSSIRDQETDIADVFLTWGWQHAAYANLQPVSGQKLIDIPKNIVPKADGNVLLLLNEMPRYVYTLSCMPLASQQCHYLNDQLNFMRMLTLQCQRLVKIKPYLVDYGWDTREQLIDQGYSDNICSGEVNFNSALRQARLAISTYDATTYLETFALNFPTVLFWDPSYWEISVEMKPYYDELRAVGILHDTPESAAALVNTIYQDPMSWWQQEHIQNARLRFCDSFAHVSEDWLQEWKQVLVSLSSGEVSYV